MYRSAQYNSVAIRDPRLTGIDGGNDNDAAAFLLAAGIVDSRQQRAIFELTRLLKQYGLWSKMKAIYPFVGGTATSHKWNLKDPRDLNVAGRLTFNGGWTHNANGITGNGSNTIALTNRTPIDYVVNESSHLSIYNRLDITGPNATPDIGAYTTGQNQAHFIFIANTSNFYDIIAYQAPQNQIAAVNTTARHGFWVNTRTSTTSMKAFRNAVQVGATNTATATGFTTIQNTGYVIGSATNSGGGYTARGYAFATIGDGLTDTDASNLYYAVDIYQRILGRAVTAKDTDAQAFVDAAVLTDSTQIGAVDNLVSDLKAAGLWSKMKAIYPFVGGTATSHMYNLKDPRNVDAAFRLSFQGGWTHSSTGADPNGTNGYANTFLAPTTSLAIASHHMSVYTRENVTDTTNKDSIGAWELPSQKAMLIRPRGAGKATFVSGLNIYPQFNVANGQGFYLLAKGTATKMDGYKNATKELNDVSATTSGTGEIPNINLWLGALNYGNSALNYSDNQLAFASIGDDLTDSEATNLYNIVQRYQRELGRNVVPFDTDAQNFVVAAGITDQTQITAIDNLVKALKDTNLWSKMKAIYPFVGGTATTHKWNLKDPRDVDAAFRLSFVGGWTHSSTGALPNGSNTYADTYITPTTHLTENSTHLAYYSRTDTSDSSHDIAMRNNTPTPITLFQVVVRANGVISGAQYSNNDGCTATNSDGRCMAISSRTSSTFQATYRNATQVQTSTRTAEGWAFCTYKLWIAARNNANVGEAWSTKQCAFASIGDGLTATDASNLYNIVQNFQTTLGRAV